MQQSNRSNQIGLLIFALAMLTVCQVVTPNEAKLLRSSRYFDDYSSSPYDSPYSGSAVVPTGERAIVTVRGARSPYDGSAPGRIAIEDQPYHRGPLPRGVYDRAPAYPRQLDGGYSHHGGYGSGYGGYGSGYNGGYGG